MKILALIADTPTSPCRIYRGEGVLERLPGCEIHYISKNMEWVKWLRAAKEFLCLYVMRDSSPSRVPIVQSAKDVGIPVWYDLDDDYFNVLPSSPAYEYFTQKSTIEAVVKFLSLADIVTVSTEQLKSVMSPYCHRIEVIPNGIEENLFDNTEAERNQSITWRGGGTHMRDLVDFMPGMTSAIQGNEYELDLLGGDVFKLASLGIFESLNTAKGRVRQHPYIYGYWDYMRYFASLKPRMHVVPLSKNLFNMSKSNISAMEALSVGALPVVPGWSEWDIPGCLRYNDEKEFAEVLKKTVERSLDDPESIMFDAVKGRNWILENRTTKKMNEKRLQILKSL